MAGSISLASMAALRTGSGLVSAAVPDRCLETVAQFDPAVMTIPLPDTDPGVFAVAAAEEFSDQLSPVDAVGFGPGMRTGEGTTALLAACLQAAEVPRVLDADGLNALSQQSSAQQSSQEPAEPPAWVARIKGPVVLTPHPGEWKRLCGVSPGDRPGQEAEAKRLAAASNAVIVLKGATTFVTDGRQHYLNRTGNPGMASGGTGDVLTGIIASLLGQGLEPFDAARLATWIHGRAGDRAAAHGGQAGMTANHLLTALPQAVEEATAAG